MGLTWGGLWAPVGATIGAIMWFAMAPDIADQPWSALLYFSFATLTTLGYGDILPLSPIARGLASVEAVAGTFFTAVLVARLVGAYGSDADVRA